MATASPISIFTAQIAFHKSPWRLATVTAVRPAKRFGAIALDGDRRYLVSRKSRRTTAAGSTAASSCCRRAVGDLSTATTPSGNASRWRRSAVRRAARLRPPRLLASDGHAARPDLPRGAVGQRPRALESLVIDRRVLGRQARLPDRPHRLQGRWMSLLLERLGAEVHGFALPPDDETQPLRHRARARRLVHHRIGDMRDLAALLRRSAKARPRHRHSHGGPISRAALLCRAGRDLCHQCNGHRPSARGGPAALRRSRRSSSSPATSATRTSDSTGATAKPTAWAVTIPTAAARAAPSSSPHAYRRSFFPATDAARVATARAGNVIGGGDWAQDRLVPDAMRAFWPARCCVSAIPHPMRPWQHVLDPLFGYLAAGAALGAGRAGLPTAGISGRTRS